MECDREGNFRGVVLESGLRKGKDGSKSVGVSLHVQLNEIWNAETEAWEPWGPFDNGLGATEYMTAMGDQWVIKKDGTPNQNAINSLVQFAGWNGDLLSVGNDGAFPTPCQFVIQADTFQNVTRYKIAFVNEYDRRPGGMGNVAPDEAKLLQDQYGQQLRALTSNAKRGAVAPAGSKPAAPPKAATPKRETVQSGNGAKASGDIPFAILLMLTLVGSSFIC